MAGFGLGDHLSANKELEEIPADMRAHPVVLLCRVRIYGEAKKWEEAWLVSDSIVTHWPALHQGWVNRSFALHDDILHLPGTEFEEGVMV